MRIAPGRPSGERRRRSRRGPSIPENAPGGKVPLGVEIDPTLAYALPRRLRRRARVRRPLPARRASTTRVANLERLPGAAGPRACHVHVLSPCDARLSLLLARVLASPSSACEPNETHLDDNAPYEAGTAAPLSCVPNLDGVIDASELAPVLGVPVKYLVSPVGHDAHGERRGRRPTRPGSSCGTGARTTPTTRSRQSRPSSLAGKWYAASFPNGQFATPFDAGDTLEAVYSQDANGLYLQGIASTQQNPSTGKTLFVYEHARDALRRSRSRSARRGPRPASSRNGMLDGPAVRRPGHLPGHRRRHRAARPARLHVHPGAPRCASS